MTIVIAAASTASPASCPPIRRGSSGRVEAVGVIRTPDPERVLPPGLGVALGVTTGNSPDRSVGDTVEPTSDGNVTGGNAGIDDVGVGEGLGWPTKAVTAASAGDSAVPCTDMVSVNCSPTSAVTPTRDLTISSNAWLAGSEPIEQTVLCADGHRLNLGDRSARPLILAVAVTRLAGTVLQTQTA